MPASSLPTVRTVASSPLNQAGASPKPLPIPASKPNPACERVKSEATYPRALKTTNSPAQAEENRASKKRLKAYDQADASPKPLPIPPGKATLACERVRSKATHPRALKTTNSPAKADEKGASKKRPNLATRLAPHRNRYPSLPANQIQRASG
jgi:hypothetical protein